MTPDEEARIRADEREKTIRAATGVYPGEMLVNSSIAAAIRSGTDTDYVCVRREWLENEILPLVEEAEFLQSQAFSYGDCGPEPSPPEWGIAVGYQQLNPDRSCAEMYEADIRKFHQDNAEEDDGDGEFFTVANRLRSLLKEKGGENG